MIKIPLINKVLRGNTVDSKAKRKLDATAKEIEELSKHPKWLEFIKRNSST